MGHEEKANTMAWVRVSSSARQRGEGRIVLEALCESSSTFCSEMVVVEPAGTKMFLLFGQRALADTAEGTKFKRCCSLEVDELVAHWQEERQQASL